MDAGVPPHSNTQLTAVEDSETHRATIINEGVGQHRTETGAGSVFENEVSLSVGPDSASVSVQATGVESSTTNAILFARAFNFSSIEIAGGEGLGLTTVPIVMTYTQRASLSQGSPLELDAEEVFGAVSSSTIAVIDSLTFEGVPTETEDGLPVIEGEADAAFASLMEVILLDVGNVTDELVDATVTFDLQIGVRYWVLLESTVALQAIGTPMGIDLAGHAFTDPVFEIDPAFEYAHLLTITRHTVLPVDEPATWMLLLASALLLIRRRGPGAEHRMRR